VENVLENVTATAVWGSLAATAFLGAFMWVQAASDRQRRARFAAFGAVCWSLGVIDFLMPHLTHATYEVSRLVAVSCYAAAVLLLLSYPLVAVVATASALSLIGLVVWNSGHLALATTVTFPIAFAVAAIAHGWQFLRSKGYASCVLTAYSVAMALSCSIYYEAVKTADGRVITLGYANWVLLNACAVLFGWIHLPRELRGQAPVHVSLTHGALLFAAVVLSEAGVLDGFILHFHWPPTVYLASSVSVVLATLLLYFHHRHSLVIYTDNVTALLEQRTASLRVAQDQLARQNELLAQKLSEQERDLRSKGEVIDRQRRVELAAQVAGEAAHDIQNLLSPIGVYLSQIEAAPGNGACESVDRIRRQVRDLLELNGQLLALSRRGRVEAQPVELGELLRSVLERFPGMPVTLDGAAPAWIRGSWAQLSRAAANLVTNALEVEPRRVEAVTLRCGIVRTTETRKCHLGFLGAGDYAFFQVEDTGPGIPEGIRERIFEPFFSSKSGPHRSGTGLGLSIVAGVVDDHKGVLDLETGSEGTRFTLYFPPIPPPSGREEDLRGNATVVVAENDTPILDQCVKTLEQAGYLVFPAKDGEEVVRILQVQSVDLLVLDLQMPTMGGAEALFAALHLRPGVRALIHTSYVDSKEETRLRALGASDVLLKPASPRELLRAVRRALGAASLSPQ